MGIGKTRHKLMQICNCREKTDSALITIIRSLPEFMVMDKVCALSNRASSLMHRYIIISGHALQEASNNSYTIVAKLECSLKHDKMSMFL